MYSRPRPTGVCWQFASRLGFGVAPRLLWAWSGHVEAGRGAMWPHGCTERCHIGLLLLALHHSHKFMSLLLLLSAESWTGTSMKMEVSPFHSQQWGWPPTTGQTKEPQALLHRKGRGRWGRTAPLIFPPKIDASGPPRKWEVFQFL